MGLDDLSTRQKVALAVTLPASMFLLYLLFRKREEVEYKPSNDLATGQFLTIEMKIPYKMVGTVIGREGSQIKQIQQESGARVRFEDESGLKEDDDRVVLIRGNLENAMMAEKLLKKLLSEQPQIQVVEMYLPQRAVGRIIGHGGENIRQICRASKAKVFVDRSEGKRDPNAKRLCSIKGTLDQIRNAQTMIQEELQAEEEYQQKLEAAAMNRKQRKPVKPQQKDDPVSASRETPPNPNNNVTVQEASPSSNNVVQLPNHPDFFTIYVSAVEHPGHFWFQIITPKARQFDLLVETMTEFYRQKQNQEDYTPKSLSTGDILAAPFGGDDLWYRAKVLAFLEDNQLDLYYVDYGDCGHVPRSHVFTLRSDFFGMSFQAVEASLSGAVPKGEEWSEEACKLFEESTYCAQWKPLMARIVSYSKSSQPCIELIDTNGPKDKNLLEELKANGFAGTPEVNRSPRNPSKAHNLSAHFPSSLPPSSPLRTVEGPTSNGTSRTSPSLVGGYPVKNVYTGETG